MNVNQKCRNLPEMRVTGFRGRESTCSIQTLTRTIHEISDLSPILLLSDNRKTSQTRPTTRMSKIPKLNKFPGHSARYSALIKLARSNVRSTARSTRRHKTTPKQGETEGC